jgi:serine/threonine protein kinase/tetratricopeptide (TPR) repeat protein
MPDESRLSDLVTRWQEQRARGREVAVTELCRDCPELSAELARRIEMVRRGYVTDVADYPSTATAFFEAGTGRRPETAWHAGPAPDPNDVATHSVADGVRTAGPAGDARSPHHGPRYRPIRLHRTGGLGHVWLARDGVLGRDVALKELRADRVGDSRLRARFLQEARITGQLEHPSIVPLYDVLGEADANGDCENPRYTMRFVAGRTLAEAIQDYHHRRRDGRATPLDLSGLLDSFVAVCHAIAYAHSRKVLHRDIKGSNIVLGDFGEVFVLDWGLAKVIGEPDANADTVRAGASEEVTRVVRPAGNVGPRGAVTPSPSPEVTAEGAVIGTPAYMAPELADGEPASVASDIYALGVLLYVLLTGQLPYDGHSTLDVLQKIRSADPPEPRSVNNAAPTALEAICRRAMARNPADRYATPEDLAADVRRWRADEPVAAHAEPWAARLARWARRHRTAVAAAVVLLVSAVVALSVSTVLIWQEERRTQAEWARAERERVRARQNFDTARTLILDMSGRIQALETGRDNPRQTDLARQAALDKAREAFDQFRADLPDDVWVQRQAADVHRFAANVARLVNDYASAEKAYAASLGIWEELIQRSPEEPIYRDNFAQTLRDQAMFQKRLGKLREATATIDRAKALADALEHELRPLSSYQRTLGTILLDRSDVEYLTGRFDASEQSARQAVALLDRLKDAPAAEANPLDTLLAAMAVHYLALAQREQGKTDEALASHEAAVGRLRALVGPKAGRGVRFWNHETRRERARTWGGKEDRRAAAAEDLAEVVTGAEKLVEEYPHDPLYRDALAATYLRRGELHLLNGQIEPAAADLEKSLALSRRVIDSYGGQSAYLGTRGQTYVALGRVSVAQGKAAEAAERFKNAIIVLKRGLEKDPDNVHHRRALERAEREAAPR